MILDEVLSRTLVGVHRVQPLPFSVITRSHPEILLKCSRSKPFTPLTPRFSTTHSGFKGIVSIFFWNKDPRTLSQDDGSRLPTFLPKKGTMVDNDTRWDL